MPRLISDDGWTLDESIAGDVDRLIAWLPDAEAIDLWGGPEFRFPYTRRSFEEDMHWGRFSLFVNPDNTPAYECYKAMGFTIADCPGETALDGIADYLTCPVEYMGNPN